MLMESLLKTRIIRVVIFLLLLLLIFIYINISAFFNFDCECPIRTITGFYCPGCGITRMFKCLFEGYIYQAFRYNPLVFLLLIVYFVYLNLDIFFHKFLIKLNNKKILIGLLIIIIIYGIMRNIPNFSFLEPTNI